MGLFSLLEHICTKILTLLYIFYSSLSLTDRDRYPFV